MGTTGMENGGIQCDETLRQSVGDKSLNEQIGITHTIQHFQKLVKPRAAGHEPDECNCIVSAHIAED